MLMLHSKRWNSPRLPPFHPLNNENGGFHHEKVEETLIDQDLSLFILLGFKYVFFLRSVMESWNWDHDSHCLGGWKHQPIDGVYSLVIEQFAMEQPEA